MLRRVQSRGSSALGRRCAHPLLAATLAAPRQRSTAAAVGAAAAAAGRSQRGATAATSTTNARRGAAAAAAAAAAVAALWSCPASCAESFYGLLGLKQGASDAEIKKAYKKAALKHHPDKVRCPPPPLLLHIITRLAAVAAA
jgi:hypothetical protein